MGGLSLTGDSSDLAIHRALTSDINCIQLLFQGSSRKTNLPRRGHLAFWKGVRFRENLMG